MKAVCQFSNLPFEVPFLSSPTRVQFYHPIFTVSLKTLLGIYAQWKDKPSFQHEDTLLFTAAFLRASNHCTFQTAIRNADPQKLIQSLETLVHLSILVASDPDEDNEIPSFIISANTASLESLPTWLSLWQESLDQRSQDKQTKLS